MDAAVLGGLVDQWVWRCQMVVTEFQLGRPIDFKGEVETLVAQAEKQARLLDGDGIVLLVKVEDRLATSAHMARRAACRAPTWSTRPISRPGRRLACGGGGLQPRRRPAQAGGGVAKFRRDAAAWNVSRIRVTIRHRLLRLCDRGSPQRDRSWYLRIGGATLSDDVAPRRICRGASDGDFQSRPVRLMRTVLEEVMTRVPMDQATPASRRIWRRSS